MLEDDFLFHISLSLGIWGALWSLPSYVECTIGMLCLFAYFSARSGSRAAIAAMITSGWEVAGAISETGLEFY